MSETTIEIKDILDANAHNSAMALTAKWTDTFKKYAMEDYEGLSDDPASSFNIFTHLTAQGAAKMMYEQAARITETNVATAILPKSLLNKITTEEMAGVFGMPASTTIAFCIKKDEIIKYGVYEATEGVYRLRINKRLDVTFESHPGFTLPYDVIINAKPITSKIFNPDTGTTETQVSYNIYAYYNMPSESNDGMRHVFNIYNQYISSREMRFEGHTYIAFFLKVFQLARKEVEFYVSNPYTADTKIQFDNMLVGMEVFRKKINSSNEILMTGLTEGTSLYTNTYNYSYDNKRNSNNLNILFSKMSDNSALSVGDTIRVVVYTTQGILGNIQFPFMIYNIDKLSIKYNQDLSDKSQNAMLNIICLAFARDQESLGGKNSLTFEELRANIISKQYSRGILISNNEIIKKGQELGLSVKKIQQDLTAMYYQCSDKLKYKNMILSTGTSNFYFDLSKKDKMLRGYNYYLISPTDVFAFNPKNNRYEYVPDNNTDGKTVESYMDYVNKYNNTTNVDSIREVTFPFYMRYENTTNPKIQIYDLFINTTEFLKFTKYNESTALDKLDISILKVVRNPYKGSVSGTFDKTISDKIFLSFIVYTGQNTLNKLYTQSHNRTRTLNYVNSSNEDVYNKQYVTFEVGFEGTKSGEKYIMDPTKLVITNIDTLVEDGYIAYQTELETNNFISDDKEIQLKGIRNAGSISKDYSVFIPVDTSIKISITGKFNDVENNPSNKECITYESDKIDIVKYLSEDFRIDFDIESVIPGYNTYENDVFYKYESDIYYKNPFYDSTETDTTKVNHYPLKVESIDGENVSFKISGNQSIPSYLIAHKSGEIIFDYKEVSEEELKEGPSELKEYYVRITETKTDDKGNIVYSIDENNDYIYEKINIDDDGFKDDIIYYTKTARIKHKKGDLVYYDKHTGEIVDIPNIDASQNVNYVTKNKTTEYIGICKNVPWINRLYMSGEYMYENIHKLYTDLIDRSSEIKKSLFDGGKSFIGLNFTSGKSKKFKAFKLTDGSEEYLNNIAMRFKFRVKYKEDTSLEYKEEQIKNSVINYINNIGDNDISIDKMFDNIKLAVPDIVYINIESINNYKYGEVQTIINDTSITDEVLTVSQKMTTTESGDIDFEPDITVNVVLSQD